MERRLAAIVAADVVGYSRMMQLDEGGTLAALTARRDEILQPLLARHNGRLVKEMGDGVLLEFASAVNAVGCAHLLQMAMTAANAELSEDRRIVLRIGINLGDIIVRDGDLYGDGVNIAARLEALADPGAILVSQTVVNHVRGKVNLGFEDLGEQCLKNMAEPVRIYRLTGMAEAGRARRVASSKLAIAVLPFANMSGDPEQDYLSDGITEDVITELSRFGELRVTARNSSFVFRGAAVDIRDVARKLDVQFVVEGSVRRAGNRVRVTVQLIEAASNAHVWADRYDRELDNVFEIQDEITRMIAARVATHSRSAVVERSRSRPTDSFSAYEIFLRARQMFATYDPEFQAEALLRKAIELDPNFAIAHALISDMHTVRYLYTGNKEHLETARLAARKSMDLDPAEPWANFALGLALTYMRPLPEAGHYLKQAITLNPNDVFFLAFYAMWLNFAGRTDEALRKIEEVLVRDPYGHEWFWDMQATILTVAKKHQDAIESFSRMKSLPPWSCCYLAISHAEVGRTAEAQACLASFRRLGSGTTPAGLIEERQPYADAATSSWLTGVLRHIETAAQA